jgi:hypothetical protein
MSKQPPSAGKIIGITCGSIFAVLVLLPALAFSNFGFGTGLINLLLPAAVIVGVILIVRNNRKIKAGFDSAQQQAVVPPQAVASAQPTYSAPVATGYPTTVCQHVFTLEELKGKTSISCPCGYTFKVQDLLSYRELSDAYLDIGDKLNQARQKLINSMQKSAATTSQSAAASSATAKPAAVQSRPRVKRNRTALTLQQWLIIGASAIIVMAGSVFVSANLNTLSSEGFLAVTSVIALVTGGLAIWGRKFSVMLANFMANFSSAMLMFSILIIGDIAFAFTWDTAPAWWWTVDLLVVAAVSTLLARFTANFGWKIASLAGLTASALTLSVGQIREMFADGSAEFGLFTAATLVFAVLIGMASKWIGTFKAKVNQVTSEVEYEKDLAKREQSALDGFTFWSVSALSVVGLGYALFSLIARAGQAPEPVTFSTLALATVLALVLKRFWIGALSSTGTTLERINTWLNILSFTTVALSLSAWIRYVLGENVWGGVASTAVLLFATVAAGFYIKKLSLHQAAIQTAHFALVGAWLLWYPGVGLDGSTTLSAVGLILVSFAMSLAYQFWLGTSRLSIVFAAVTNFIGLLAIALGLRINQAFEITSVDYALFSLGLVVLSIAFVPITALTAQDSASGLKSGMQQVYLWLTGALVLFLAMPSIPVGDQQNVNLAAVIAISALATGLLSVISNAKQLELSNLLSKYSYLFQGATMAILLLSLSAREELAIVGTAFLAFAGFNYALAWVSKRPTSVWLAYGFSLAGLLLVADAQRENWLISTHLALVIVLALALNFALRIVDKRVSGRYNSYFAIFSIFGSTLGSLVINYSKWTNIENSDQVLIGLGLFVLIALLSASLGELKRFNKGKLSMALRVTGLAYLVLAFVSFVQLPLNEELSATYGDLNLVYYRIILVGVVFAAITLRQLKLVSKEGDAATYGWFALSYLAPVSVALTASGLLANHVEFGKFELELYTIPLAIALAIPALFNSALEKRAKQIFSFDVPVLFPVATSLIFAITENIDESTTVYRLLVSSLVLAAFAQWKLSTIKNVAWVTLSYLGLVGLALSLGQLVEVQAPDLWDGPEVFGFALAAAVFQGNRNASQVFEFKSTIFTRGLPLFVLLLPSILETYKTLDVSIELTNPVQITRILSVLVISLLALILGIRGGSLGSALAGGASLTLLVLPITWVSAGTTNDLDNTIALRGLAIALFLYLFLGGLRSINKIPDSSYLYLGIPTVVGLGPALFLTLSSIGDSELTQVDWWRFGIVVGTSIVLLVVGALRSLGGLFFPGLVGVVLGVLPYAFQPVARESWFLWVVLLLIAAVMVWIAVRLENIRKLGKSGVSWIKALR